MEVKAKYQAAQASQYRRLPPKSKSGDKTIGQAGTRLRDWARHLDENVDLVTGAFDKLVNFIVGPGIAIEPLVKARDGSLLQSVNADIRALITDHRVKGSWSRDCNVTGQYRRGEQERIACRTWLRDGEILGRKVPVRSTPDGLPYLVELIEADHLPYHMCSDSVVHGVEKDQWGRPVFFHIAGVRISAEEIVHLKFTRRANQTRGVPLPHSTIVRVDDLHDYENAVRVGARMSAHIVAAIESDVSTSGEWAEDGDEKHFDMEYGTVIKDLRPGQKLTFYKPENPNPNAPEFIDDQIRRFASGIGLGYSTVANKYDKSFSAARQEQSESWLNILRLRDQFVNDFIIPLEYEPVLELAINLRKIRLPRNVDPRTIFSADYRGPSRPTLDDLKQAGADQKNIASKVDSRKGIIRDRGRDPTQVDAEIESDV